MSGVQLQADRRFRRARVQPARRRAFPPSGPVLRLLLLLAALGAAAWYGPDLLRRVELLRVEQVVIKGNRHVSSGEVLALLGGVRGANILDVDLAACRERLLQAGWVRDATLRRALPATIEVTIAEREPIGLFRVATGLYLVDPTGTVIDEYRPQLAHLQLPVIDGLDLQKPRGSAGERARTLLAARLMQSLAERPDLAGQVSQIDVSDASDAVVLLSGDAALLHLGHEHFVERLDRYLELAQALRGAVPDIDHVDLRYERRVYVRPADDGHAVANGL